MHKRIPIIVLWICFASGALADGPWLNIQTPVSNVLHFSGMNVSNGNAFALQVCDSLSTGQWSYVPPVDAWPSAQTNWTVGHDSDTLYFRLQTVEGGRLS